MVVGLWGGGETDALHNHFNVELRLGNQVCNEGHSIQGVRGGEETREMVIKGR